ncbi:hypothetical protein BCL57_001399 [Agromyces flavus]|uniref:Uncharacterized protein n=1 Tax=Agromyces flavus TaxID=589382 RepID=A0A1H1ZSS8_9MICO|nr:hypothetical protein [Agromyces flavus]MCP2367245.1 hypothetical protein [Agromyces flavus]GGI46112.1 hypothetical protein GCM10010932_12970 [Agromyces flavus]SDT36659.1 hypothetical protein SAMN04489721_3324 [Agromyces flavus]
MLAIISAIAFGVTIGGVVGAIATGDPRYAILWSISLTVAILAGTFAGLGAVGLFGRGRSDASQAPPAGELTLARVERIGRTGLSVNDQPQVELVLTVAPRFRQAYTTVHRQILDIVALPQVQPGSIIVVRRPDDAKANVDLVLDPPDDWARLRDAERLRTGTDRTVPVASQAPAWASEPQALFGGPRKPARPWRRVLLAGVTVATAAIVLIPAYDTIGRTVQAFASGNPDAASVVLGDRHAEIVDALAAETGGTQFVSVAFYDSYALATAPSAPGALTMDVYQFRYDRTEHQGPELIQPDDPAAALFDVSEVDFSRIPEHIATAEEHSGITDPTSVIVSVERALIADASGARPVRVLVILDSTYEDATVQIDAASGEVLG